MCCSPFACVALQFRTVLFVRPSGNLTLKNSTFDEEGHAAYLLPTPQEKEDFSYVQRVVMCIFRSPREKQFEVVCKMAEAVTTSAAAVASAATSSASSSSALSAKLTGLNKYVEQLSAKLQDFMPKNTTIWVLLLVAIIGIVALSRLMSMQKSVAELQARPYVDEYTVRKEVRGQLEETVKAIEQQNKLQLQLRQEQALQEARRQAQEQHARQQAEAAARAQEEQRQQEQRRLEEAKKAEEEAAKKAAAEAEAKAAEEKVEVVAPAPSSPAPSATATEDAPVKKKKGTRKTAEVAEV